MNSKKNSLLYDPNIFLRSINLSFDAADPKRIAHFRPTAKSIPLIHGLLANGKDRAFLVVAPYGSGKSLTLTYLLNIIENRPEALQVLIDIEKRIKNVSSELYKQLISRRKKKRHGLVITLHGYLADLPNAIKEATINAFSRNKLDHNVKFLENLKISNIEDTIRFLQILKDVCLDAKLDKLCILWDETGRHIETLISSGRAIELSDIQVIAEYVSRSTDLPVTFGLTLHQSLLHYSQKMSQSVRAEWMKISGRFDTIQYVDDSKETYRLISDIIESKRGDIILPSKRKFQKCARESMDQGFFVDFTKDELVSILEMSYPFNPTSLYLLPRISSRVAQNERTLFTFLFNASVVEDNDVPALYDYFSQSMHADATLGGTYKQWLETESAISKSNGKDAHIKTLKTACLLGLGTKGERSRIGIDTLIYSMRGYKSNIDWDKTVSDLIKKKLLLYRTHSQEVSVWHGTDVDLRGRLADDMERHRGTFKLLAFLNQEVRPVAWKPIEYNTEFGIDRYWSGEYHTAADFEKLISLDNSIIDIPNGCDGKIFYLTAESDEELSFARKIAHDLIKLQIIIVIPSAQIHLKEAALEVWCLSHMQHNSELTGPDPLILPEIQQMQDDARSNLQNVIDKLIKPTSKGPYWFYKGKQLHISNTSQLRRELSKITRRVFSHTPKIHNEMINRHKPSGTIVNSRKKLVMGILERHGTPDLGLKSSTPDASMFRTILCHTGLYKKKPTGEWDYVSEKNQSLKQDLGLITVWGKIRDFFEISPENGMKSPRLLIDELLSPPIGLRKGLLPILFAVGLKKFAKAISLRHKREYVTDILPSIIEDICKNPDEYELEIVKLDNTKKKYFEIIRKMFQGAQVYSSETDLVRSAYDAIQSWLFQLPKASLSAESVTNNAKAFQCLMQKSMNSDPVAFLLRELPSVCGFKYTQISKIQGCLEPLKTELENVSHTYARKACDSIYQAVSRGQSKKYLGVQSLATQWANYFPNTIISTNLPGIARGLLSRMKMRYDNEVLFANSLALLLVGKSTEDWDDSTAIEFENKIQELTYKIENTSLNTLIDLSESQVIREGLSNLVSERIENLYAQLEQLIGSESSKSIIMKIMKGRNNGQTK